MGEVLHDVLGEIILELFLFVIREVVLDLGFASADVGHEVGGLLGNLLIVVGQIGAYVLLAAAAVLVLGAGFSLFALRAGLRLGGNLRLWLGNGFGFWYGIRDGLRFCLDLSSGGIP